MLLWKLYCVLVFDSTLHCNSGVRSHEKPACIHPPRQGLVSYYVSEPYEYRPGQEQQYKLADLSRRSPLFDKWHKVWFNRKKAESKSWLEDKKNGYRGRVWTPLFDKSVDDNRRETFSDFQEVVSAVRCLAQGLATANALPPDPHGIEPEPRLMVLQSVYVVLNLVATATRRLPPFPLFLGHVSYVHVLRTYGKCCL